MKTNSILGAAFVAMLLALVIGCGGNNSPTAPSGPPALTEGWIHISYAPQIPCLRAGTSAPGLCDRSRFPVTFGGIGWPAKYAAGSINIKLTEQNDGTYTGEVFAPAGSLRMSVNDPWLCPLGIICSEQTFTGRGLTANGTRLPDSDRETVYNFVPK
jgi:hypothetical protein